MEAQILALQKCNKTSYFMIVQQASTFATTGQNFDVTVDVCKNSENLCKALFGTCEYHKLSTTHSVK